MLTDTAGQVGPVLDEAVKEVLGTSHKKWALVVVAFVAGAVGAVWLIRRGQSTDPVVAPADVATA